MTELEGVQEMLDVSLNEQIKMNKSIMELQADLETVAVALDTIGYKNVDAYCGGVPTGNRRKEMYGDKTKITEALALPGVKEVLDANAEEEVVTDKANCWYTDPWHKVNGQWTHIQKAEKSWYIDGVLYVLSTSGEVSLDHPNVKKVLKND